MKVQHFFNLKIYFLFLFFLFQLAFENNIKAQVQPPGIVWVVPNRPDAFPVNGNRTGNSGLNLLFEEFNVIDYTYLDSFFISPYIPKIPIYQIRMLPLNSNWELDFVSFLFYCYRPFFSHLAIPYSYVYALNGQAISYDNGNIILAFYDHYFDPTLVPSSNTRSFNKHMNKILQKYDIKSYSYHPFVVTSGDTLWRHISILCQYQDIIPLYYDLLTIDYLYEEISIIPGFKSFTEIEIPCGPYSDISFESKTTINIFPNPAQDEITISGETPESVTLYDIMGKMVVSKFDIETNKINLKNLPNGLYIIKIITQDGKIFTDKVIKQNIF